MPMRMQGRMFPYTEPKVVRKTRVYNMKFANVIDITKPFNWQPLLVATRRKIKEWNIHELPSRMNDCDSCIELKDRDIHVNVPYGMNLAGQDARDVPFCTDSREEYGIIGAFYKRNSRITPPKNEVKLDRFREFVQTKILTQFKELKSFVYAELS